jgi:hypothetical protein
VFHGNGAAPEILAPPMFHGHSYPADYIPMFIVRRSIVLKYYSKRL